MKNAISNIWLLGLVVLFIFVFSGYLAITISYSNAFKIKNEVIGIIERHNGMSQGQSASVKSISGNGQVTDVSAMETINLYLYGMAYKTRGTCPNDGRQWYGATTLVEGARPVVTYESYVPGRLYYYCFAKSPSDYGSKRQLDTFYYDVVIFYRLELPVFGFPGLGNLFTFRIEGTTNDIRGTNDNI